MREYFMKTKRIGFSRWRVTDLDLAIQLWGDQEVTRLICAEGSFTQEEIKNRLQAEISNDELYDIQYWPIFELATKELIGCSGIRPFNIEEGRWEIGTHLRPKYWSQGYGFEASKAVIDYSFNILKVDTLFAGHHPQNQASEKLLKKLGFQSIGKSFYEPTGLFHPSYELVAKNRLV